MLRLKVFTLSFSQPMGGFDDSVLVDFIKDKEVISVREHFFSKDEIPYWAIMVLYNAAHVPPVPEPASKKGEDYRNRLSNEHWPLFNTLKTWRAERAKAEGIPPYLICTNNQLADMVLKLPNSLTQLEQIDGIGKAKLEKYGQEMLGLLKQPDKGE